MPHGRRRRTAVTLLPAALVVVLPCFGAGAFHPANSAGKVRHSAVAARHEQMRKAPPLSPVVATKRGATYGIAFFGDSLSVGAGTSDRNHGYVAGVSRSLRMRGMKVIATVNARGGVPVAYWAHAPMPTKLDAAVVELGTNDVRFGTPSGRFAQEYRTLTGRIRAASPKAQLLCLSVWSRRKGARLEGLINAQIRAVCRGAYVDITRLRDRAHIRSGDGFHPNDVGYRLIAQAVVSKLKTG